MNALDLWPALIAQAPGVGPFANGFKIAGVVVIFFVWLLLGQWMDRDLRFIKGNREQWNLIAMAGCLVGIAAWLILPFEGPLYFVGLLVYVVVGFAPVIIYIVYRNRLVASELRVFTPHHIGMVLSNLTGGKKEKKIEAVERVRLSSKDGKVVGVPEEQDERKSFVATQDLVSDALWRRASEVDVAVAGDKVKIAFRIDGTVTKRKDLLNAEDAWKALDYLKQIAGLNVDERRRPQEGRISATFPVGTRNLSLIDVRTSGSTAGERLHMRVVTPDDALRVPALGFAAQRQEMFQNIIGEREGLVIISGPKSHGVTTTMYATLRQHDAFLSNIHALERQRLMELENITQHTHDSQNQDLGFARQLQTIIRREPDVVMVGDCPDHETAELSSRAAMNGKKIYLQIAAGDSFAALAKYVRLVENNKQAARPLLAVTNQRLVRKLCTVCREAYKPDENLLKKANLPTDKISHFYRPPAEPEVDKKGNPIICGNCQGTGYFGRAAIFEVLLVTDPMREMIASGAKLDLIKAEARKNKMLYLQEEGLLKVIEGLTSMNEILRVLKAEKG